MLGVLRNIDVGSPSTFNADPRTLQPVDASTGQRGHGVVGGNVALKSDQPTDFDANYRAAFGRRFVVDGYETVDLRAGIDFQRFTIKAYLNNLFDSRGLISATYSTQAASPAIGGTGENLGLAAPVRPRTIGLTAGLSF